MESQPAIIKNARIFNVRSEQFCKLNGFEKHHKIPTSVNARALDWVDQLTSSELDKDLQEVVDLLRANFHFKRRHLDVHGPEDRRGVIETPYFNYEVGVDLDHENPSWIMWRREINHIRHLDQIMGQAFLNCFAKANWRLEVAWDREIELADIIDRIEDGESPDIQVDYGKDLKWCQIILANSPSTLLITNGTFQISRQTSVAPRDLIGDLISFQSYLLDQFGAPGIGQSTVVSPDT